jgi:hypothetical protein
MIRKINKAFSILETVMAISMFSVLIITMGAFGYTANNFLQSIEAKARVINDAGLVMAHIQERVRLAHGDNTDKGILFGASGSQLELYIRQDDFTPGNYRDDNWVKYTYYATGLGDDAHSLTYCDDWDTTATTCNSPEIILSNRIRFDPSTSPAPGMAFVPSSHGDNFVNIPFLIVRYKPSDPPNAFYNPELAIYQSIEFGSSSHTASRY